jgi:transcriptional/translational regulatory protein YebC/TACO1
MFKRRARVAVRAADEEELLLTSADVGAEDVEGEEDGNFSVYGKPEELQSLRQGLIEHGVDVVSAEFTYEPSMRTEVGSAEQEKILSLLDALDDQDDIQDVFTNADFSE